MPCARARRRADGRGFADRIAVRRAPLVSVYEFDVAVSTHDLLRQGITEAHYVRAWVEADTHNEASIVACQMATIAGMPTGLYDRI